MKRVFMKSYLSNGTYVTTLANATFLGFTKDINAGPSECLISLNQKFDVITTNITLGNRIDVLVSDADTANTPESSRLIYSGYISMVEPNIDGGKENVTIHLLGYYTLLSQDILKNGTQTKLFTHVTTGLTVTSPGSAADVGLIMRTIIDRYRAENPGTPIRYTNESIPLASSTAFYVFQAKTYREAMDKVKDMAPANYYWYVDETGTVFFKLKGTGTSHSLAFGREIISAHVERGIEKVKNVIIIWNGETGVSQIYKHYQDDVSIAQFGRRVALLTDYGLGNSAAADSLAAKLLAENSRPDLKITVKVADGNENSLGYDIESVNPGDVCTFYNFNSTLADIFREAMMITKVDYTPDSIIIEVEVIKSGIVDWSYEMAKNIANIQLDGSPDSYT